MVVAPLPHPLLLLKLLVANKKINFLLSTLFFSCSTRTSGLGCAREDSRSAVRFNATHATGFGEAAALVQGHYRHSVVQVSVSKGERGRSGSGGRANQFQRLGKLFSWRKKRLSRCRESVVGNVTQVAHIHKHTRIHAYTHAHTHMPATGIHQKREVIVNILCRHRTCRIFHTFFVRCLLLRPQHRVFVCVYACVCVHGKDAPVHAVIIHFVIINVKHIRLQLPSLKCSKFSRTHGPHTHTTAHTHAPALATPFWRVL